jgi:hypothetical protein
MTTTTSDDFQPIERFRSRAKSDALRTAAWAIEKYFRQDECTPESIAAWLRHNADTIDDEADSAALKRGARRLREA